MLKKNAILLSVLGAVALCAMLRPGAPRKDPQYPRRPARPGPEEQPPRAAAGGAVVEKSAVAPLPAVAEVLRTVAVAEHARGPWKVKLSGVSSRTARIRAWVDRGLITEELGNILLRKESRPEVLERNLATLFHMAQGGAAEEALRLEAIAALGRYGDGRALSTLLPLALADPNLAVQKAALQALSRWVPDRADVTDHLLRLAMGPGDPSARQAALSVLADRGVKVPDSVLVALSNEPGGALAARAGELLAGNAQSVVVADEILASGIREPRARYLTRLTARNSWQVANGNALAYAIESGQHLDLRVLRAREFLNRVQIDEATTQLYTWVSGADAQTTQLLFTSDGTELSVERANVAQHVEVILESAALDVTTGVFFLEESESAGSTPPPRP